VLSRISAAIVAAAGPASPAFLIRVRLVGDANGLSVTCVGAARRGSTMPNEPTESAITFRPWGRFSIFGRKSSGSATVCSSVTYRTRGWT